MAISAYVFINTDAGKVDKVLEKVKKLPDVKEAHIVTGYYDVIVRVQADDLLKLGEVVAEKIHEIDGVRSTTTSIIV
ncbi:MAG: Lrp/AsnC ligand binding domain-containing protein [bacterium]|nr:Lrp/AsnC ligand binding domain-containing protein [bacterium]